MTRLRYAKKEGFNEVLGEVIDLEEGHDEILDIVEDRIKDGYYVLMDHLAQLVSKTKR
jgi:hypothetical protein